MENYIECIDVDYKRGPHPCSRQGAHGEDPPKGPRIGLSPKALMPPLYGPYV